LVSASGWVGQQAVDLEQEFFADGDEVGLGDVVDSAERFDEAGQTLPRLRSAVRGAR
jgi:hypothetical protein